MNKIPQISYLDRDFVDIKNALLNYAKKYYPNTFKDLNEAGINALLLDLVSYVGDIQSFYLDYQANESFLQTAIEFANIIRHGKSLGYKHSENPTSSTLASFYIVVPATSSGPNRSYLPILKRNSIFGADGGGSFILVDDVDFANENNEIVVAVRDSTSGLPISYAVKAYGKVISGTKTKETVTIGNYKKFLRVELKTTDISEIESIVDSEGHEWYEVEYLSQNVIYKPILNTNSDRDLAPNLLRPFIVPRRFVTDRERRKTFLQFGFGSDSTLTDTDIADPSEVMLRMVGRNYVSDTSFDPNRLMETDKLGVVPSNTTLTISIRQNAVGNVNAPVGTLTSVMSPVFSFDEQESLDSSTVQSVISSLECDNEEPIVGDVELKSSDEIKRRILDSYATQNRAVTALDYAALIYNMPAQFGKIKRVGVSANEVANRKEIEVYLVSEDSNGYLVPANDTLKENVKNWLLKYKMMNDFIRISDCYIVNFGIEYEAVSDLSRNRFDIQIDAATAFQTAFELKKNVGEPFIISEIYDVLKKVKGVVDVTKVKVFQKRGVIGDKTYSSVEFNPDKHYSDDGRYIVCPKNVIFEVKYPNSDIVGSIS